MLSLIERYGYLIVFLGVMLEGVGIPLPGETVLITAGALAHRGSLTLWETMVMGSLGAVMGGQAGYLVGRFGGRPFVLRWGRYAFITPERWATLRGSSTSTGGGRSSWRALSRACESLARSSRA